MRRQRHRQPEPDPNETETDTANTDSSADIRGYGYPRQSAIRRPAVAGYFYPSDPATLAGAIDGWTAGDTPGSQALGVVVPHGSYRRCGAIIGQTLARQRIPRRCIVLGPSHTGSRIPWSVLDGGAYRTPLGDAPIDERCAAALRARCPFLVADPGSQRGEHAIEVVLPFLQRLGPADLAIVPIVIASDDEDESVQLASALAHVVRMQEEPVLLIASSDLSHDEPRERAEEQDRVMLEAIGSLEGSRLLRDVEKHAVRMCGDRAIAVLLTAVKALGARAATLVCHETSALSGGDPQSVIGYAGVVIT